MATDIAAVLLVPAAGDPLGLLREGPCGARPPMVARWDHEDTWTHGYHGRSYSPRDAVPSVRFALALAWDGAPVAEAIDRWWRSPGNDVETDLAAEAVARLLLQGGDLGTFDPGGTLVLLDADGREVQRAE